MASLSLYREVACVNCGQKVQARQWDITNRTSYLCGCLDNQTIGPQFLDVIDSEAKAYMLGLLILVVVYDEAVLNHVIRRVWPGSANAGNSAIRSITTVPGPIRLVDAACTTTGPESALPVRGFPVVNTGGFYAVCEGYMQNDPPFLDKLTDSHKMAFVRGLFESVSWPNYQTWNNGYISSGGFGDTLFGTGTTIPPPFACIVLKTANREFLDEIEEAVGVATTASLCTDKMLVWTGVVGTLDFLDRIYGGAKHFKLSFQEKYLKLCVNTLVPEDRETIPTITVARVNELAFLPSKVRASDSGYDLTIIHEVKRMLAHTVMYDTGLRVIPPEGWYLEIVPRSSLSKSGWMLANSVGVVDRSYRGNVMVVVVRVNDNAPDLQLPFTGFQLVPRPIRHFPLVEVKADKLDITTRGDGGFGSTGARV